VGEAHLSLGSCGHTFSWAGPEHEKSEKSESRPDRVQTRARPDLDPFFSTNIQHPVCTWTYRDHGLTTYNSLSREKNRYTIISWCLFLSINAPKIESCRLVGPDPRKKSIQTRAPVWACSQLPTYRTAITHTQDI